MSNELYGAFILYLWLSRPLARGAVTPKQAVVWLAAQLGLVSVAILTIVFKPGAIVNSANSTNMLSCKFLPPS